MSDYNKVIASIQDISTKYLYGKKAEKTDCTSDVETQKIYFTSDVEERHRKATLPVMQRRERKSTKRNMSMTTRVTLKIIRLKCLLNAEQNNYNAAMHTMDNKMIIQKIERQNENC